MFVRTAYYSDANVSYRHCPQEVAQGERQNMKLSLNVISVTKSKRIIQAEPAVCMGKRRNALKIVVGKTSR
jgi:hypothetical protein